MTLVLLLFSSLRVCSDVNVFEAVNDLNNHHVSVVASNYCWCWYCSLQGHIVTNYHVIQNASAAQVTLANNKKFYAKLKGFEGDKDLAVLKIDAPADELVPIEVGVSSRLVVGQRVFAIGNPFGLDHTLTAGWSGRPLCSCCIPVSAYSCKCACRWGTPG